MGRRGRWWLACGMALTACGAPATALIDGQVVQRPTLEFTGDPYQIRHQRAHPRPGGPSGGLRAAGGDLTGRICGMMADFEVQHEGDHVQLVGTFDGDRAAQIQVRDREGARIISGRLGNLGVDLRLTSNELKGSVGLRTLVVVQEGDDLVGHIRTPGIVADTESGKGAGPIVLHGRDALWSLPPADQGLILAGVLTCQWRAGLTRVVIPFEAGFGGPPGDRPQSTSSLYTHGN